MKLIINYLTIFITVLFFAGCEDNITGIKEVSLNQEFELPVNQTVHIKDTDLLITFVKVTEDSRCPENALCLWEGNGEIELKINAHKQEQIDSLNTFLEPKESHFYEYKIELMQLMPYPTGEFDEETGTFKEIDPDDYVVKLKVTALEFGAA